MSNFHGRRGPNVSEYIANLNAIPSAHDLANQNQENFNLEDDLAMFTNTQFFDFDLGQDADLQPAAFDIAGQPRRGNVPMPSTEMKNLDFMSDFAFPDFGSFPPQSYRQEGLPALPPTVQNHSAYAVSSSGGSPPPGTSHAGEKRNAESMSDGSRGSAPYEESSRVAAEEDKRRRNTAASARFRVKKKQREAALERSAKEMSDKVSALEGRINQLETENKWLKNLITEKNENKDDIATLWKKYSQETGDRKGSERKDGVGTKA